MTAAAPASASARRTLWRHLLAWALGALALVWGSLVVVAWYTGHHEAREITDGQLIATSRLWLATAPDDHRPLNAPLNRDGLNAYVLDMAVLQWEGDRLRTDTHGLAARLPADALRPGLSTVVLQGDGAPHEWRMYVAEDPAEWRRVAVLLDMGQRYDLAMDMAQHMARPALLIMPLIAVVLWWAIRRGLRPLDRLSREVASLDTLAGQRLQPHHQFREFASIVHAINTLVDNLQDQAQRERQFASDVAHELRTPLAAMTLQASAARADPSPERLDQLERESLRAGRILAQLLDLARAQRPGRDEASALTQVALGDVAADLVAAHAPLAYEQGHELALVQPDGAVRVQVRRLLLELALRNLIENAIRHTPAGTQVVVEVWQDAQGIGVAVSDDGQRPLDLVVPAGVERLPLARRDADGLGLGLRLVQRIAEQLGAQFRRDTPPAPMTTRFALVWPAAATPEDPA
ncbi:sensor histidine kinase [Hydrogenophaga sp. NFH-34]|uniref:sensor histidine kinase n=1 Tax=Hydrogenophaga sp. NFH-34 TaxID=2744446 RepID=UPI001F1DFA40|nr:histidine kinase dimerization/phospho-acceptor domain-containing protein [Hydrogenophaga sp. NFH-34]